MKRLLLVLLSLLPLNLYAQGAGTPPYRGVNNWNLIFGTDNVFDIGANAAQRPRTGYFGTSVITPALTVSGLTATRMLFADTGGAIAGDADCTFTTDTLTCTKLAAGAGSSSATSIRMTDDNTGFAEVTSTNWGWYVNGTERVRLGSGGAVSNTGGYFMGSTIAGADVSLVRVSAGVASINSGSSTRALLGGGANVASATALAVPVAGVYHVTGTTTITSITSTNLGTGVCIVLIFDGILTLTDGSNLKLAGDFVTSADDTWTGCYDGTNWYETGRTVN